MAHIHILGICGTFMGGIARIAVSMGHQVTGSDLNTYPPMSTQLEALGIELSEGYHPQVLQPAPDLVIIGNAMSRGNAAVEYVLNQGIAYVSGPQWLYREVLYDKWVLAVSGTHGKTTTSSMLCWILEYCGYNPSYLIGGVAVNFEYSARITDSSFFVIEADEYDSAFFDKRSKMIHYHPRTLLINNLEFDHADIFKDLSAIQTQFHHLLRTVPSHGKIIYPNRDENIKSVLEMGCWSEKESLGQGGDWQVRLLQADGSQFELVNKPGSCEAEVSWGCIGVHNVNNGVAAMVAARHVGVPLKNAAEALSKFAGVSRRMELKFDNEKNCLYDDFAHHPTAIKTTLAGLRSRVADKRIIAILEPRSNTMRMGVHKNALIESLREADKIWVYMDDSLAWQLPESLKNDHRVTACSSVERIIADVMAQLKTGDQIVMMSNGGFKGLSHRLQKQLERLNEKQTND